MQECAGCLENVQQDAIRKVVTWAAMILGHVDCQQGQQALELFDKCTGRLDMVTFVGLLTAHANSRARAV
jgi:hypothetical protein